MQEVIRTQKRQTVRLMMHDNKNAMGNIKVRREPGFG
jgi:hypothetical protein